MSNVTVIESGVSRIVEDHAMPLISISVEVSNAHSGRERVVRRPRGPSRRASPVYIVYDRHRMLTWIQ